MRILILGGTGLLGCALYAEAEKRGHVPMSAARKGADHTLDLQDDHALETLLGKIAPDMVMNAAALVDLAACEAAPALAHAINARPAHTLATWCAQTGQPFVHISTDHFFDGDGNDRHDEVAKVTLCNAYARSKYAAEGFALAAPNALVLRTALAGFHPDGRGFAHWAMNALESRKPLTLFDDYYGSVIDIEAFSAALFDLVEKQARGLFNLASRDVSSKKEFILALATAAGITPDWAQSGSVTALRPRRARSLGLDVAKAEAALGYALPGRDTVCAALVAQGGAQS